MLISKIRALYERREDIVMLLKQYQSYNHEDKFHEQEMKLNHMDLEIARQNYSLARCGYTLKELLKETNNFPDVESRQLLTEKLLKDKVIAYHAKDFSLHKFTMELELQDHGELQLQMDRVSPIPHLVRNRLLDSLSHEDDYQLDRYIFEK